MIASREYVKDLISKVLTKFTKNKIDPINTWMNKNKSYLEVKCFSTGNNTGKYVITNLPMGSYILIGSGNSWGAFANGQKSIHFFGNGSSTSTDTLNSVAYINTSGSSLGYSVAWNAPPSSIYGTLTITTTIAYRMFYLIRLDVYRTMIDAGSTTDYSKLNY